MGHRGIILPPLYMGYSPAGSLVMAVSNTVLLQGASPLGWRGQTAPVPPPPAWGHPRGALMWGNSSTPGRSRLRCLHQHTLGVQSLRNIH